VIHPTIGKLSLNNGVYEAKVLLLIVR